MRANGGQVTPESQEGTRGWPVRLLMLLSCAPLVAHIGWMARAFALRLTYPVDINWCEGGVLYHAYRLRHGMPLYAAPDSIFLSLPYPPGHYALLALVGVAGVDYGSGRLLSIVFFASFCVVVFATVRSAVRDRPEGIALGLLAVTLVVSTVGSWGACADLVRAESVMMGWIGASLWIVGPSFPSALRREHPAALTAGRTAALTVALVAAAFTKQTALLWMVWILFALSWVDWRGALRVAASCAGVTVLLLGLLQWTSGGWYWKWTLSWPMEQAVLGHRIVEGALHVWRSAPYLTLLPVGLALLVKRRPSRRLLLWGGSFFVAVPISLLPYAREAGWYNNLGPALVLGVAATILAIAELLGHAPADRLRRAGVAACLAIGVAWLFLPMHYQHIFIPNAAERSAARQLNQYVAELPGTVLMPYLPFIPVRNGKGDDQWHAIAFEDVQTAKIETWKGRRRAIQRAGADWVLLPANECRVALPPGYRVDHSLPPELVARAASSSPVATDTVVKRASRR